MSTSTAIGGPLQARSAPSTGAARRSSTEPDPAVLRSLEALCRRRGLGSLAERIGDLAELVRWDMAEVETALRSLPRSERAVHRGAHHLLDQGGKRLRPLCVALAARMGTGFSEAARELGVAVELVHCATLLHDDVVDDGEQRRGAPAARTIYGNAASIFAGDWLLVHALQRVRRTGIDGTLDRLLTIIDEMIAAESLQLESRGQLDLGAERYFAVVEGKTAALFRWAMYAGAKAGGATETEAKALESYGDHLGVAFQLVDDLLDYGGDADTTGKALFADLREGKATHPLILARERDPQVEGLVRTVLENDGDDAALAEAHALLAAAIEGCGAIDDCRALAGEHARLAVEALEPFTDGPAKTALITVARATVHRER
ncbi:MAG: polyprenyl synthetase family protein [Deltaproteobacteria bacterium]|nr:polyprenyl synthetase family protein [Deltaproteobacteria bacterium]